MESCSEEGEPEDQNLIYTDDEGKKIPPPEDGEYQGGMGTYNLSTMDDKGRLQVMKMRLEDLIKDGGTFEEFARTVAYQRDLIKQNSEMEEDPEEDAERCPVTGKLRKSDEEDKTGDLSDKELLKKVKKMGTAGDALIKAAEDRLEDGMSLTAHERDALGRDAYGDAEKELAKESVSYTTKYII